MRIACDALDIRLYSIWVNSLIFKILVIPQINELIPASSSCYEYRKGMSADTSPVKKIFARTEISFDEILSSLTYDHKKITISFNTIAIDYLKSFFPTVPIISCDSLTHSLIKYIGFI